MCSKKNVQNPHFLKLLRVFLNKSSFVIPNKSNEKQIHEKVCCSLSIISWKGENSDVQGNRNSKISQRIVTYMRIINQNLEAWEVILFWVKLHKDNAFTISYN